MKFYQYTQNYIPTFKMGHNPLKTQLLEGESVGIKTYLGRQSWIEDILFK